MHYTPFKCHSSAIYFIKHKKVAALIDMDLNNKGYTSAIIYFSALSTWIVHAFLDQINIILLQNTYSFKKSLRSIFD